jgi:predicted amidophosphoribosyltransferase
MSEAFTVIEQCPRCTWTWHERPEDCPRLYRARPPMLEELVLLQDRRNQLESMIVEMLVASQWSWLARALALDDADAIARLENEGGPPL